MPHSPQRPFVPPAAPETQREAARVTEFKIARPFVHGAQSAPMAPPAAGQSARPAGQPPTRAADIPPTVGRPAPPPLPLVYDPPASPPRALREFRAQEPVEETLEPIQNFLHDEPAGGEELAGINEYSYEPPPVEHFLDAPSDEAVAAAESVESAGNNDFFPDLTPPEGSSEWSEAEWQQFDWRSAAALGESADPAASDAWLDTDWEKPASRPSEKRESAAKAIADALDGIARRIREGDLVIPSPGSVATPADIAATLAALLGVKR